MAGRQEADLVLKGGHVFNVFLKTWEDADIAISGSKIVGIGNYMGKQNLDVTGLYLTPGLMDAHVHFESSMLSPREMVKVLLLNGVTGAITDPHEITNVLGENGFRFMLEETAGNSLFRLHDGAFLRSGDGHGYFRRPYYSGKHGTFAQFKSQGAWPGGNDELPRNSV